MNGITATVAPDELPATTARIASKNKIGWNAYVRAGPMRRVFQGEVEGSSPTDADIAAQTWVYVDIDVPKRATTDADRAEWIAAAMTTVERARCALTNVVAGTSLPWLRRRSRPFQDAMIKNLGP